MERHRLDRKIELIENDDSLPILEKLKIIRKLERNYRDAAAESWQEAYENDYNAW